MGVMWHAAYQTKDAKGVLHGQPSPVDGDPSTPWPWRLWLKYMPEFTRYGGTVLVTPPLTKGASLGTGYDPYNHNDIGSNKHGPAGRRETRYGSVEDMMALVASCRALGMQVYTNVVHHHMDGDSGNYAYNYLSGDGKNPGRFPLDENCFWVWSKEQPTNPDGVFNSSTDWSFGREFRWNSGTYGDGQGDNGPGYVKRGLADALDRQTRRLDLEGYFPDDGKGTNTAFLEWLYKQKSMADKFAFAEVSDGQTGNLMKFMAQTGNRLGVMDFALRYKIRDVCNSRADFRGVLHEGVCWTDPLAAVTFVEDIDLDLSDPVISRKRLAYALILALPGYPMVFGKDLYSHADGGYGMMREVMHMVWTHETFAKGDTLVRAAGADYLVIERMGDATTTGALYGFTTRNSWVQVPVATKWKGQHLHDYDGQAIDKWTDANGMLDLWIPPDGDGAAGRGHCCYAVAGVDNPIHLTPRRTTQVFIGAADLDLGCLTAGLNKLGRMLAAEGTPISFKMTPSLRVNVQFLDDAGMPVLDLYKLPKSGDYTVAVTPTDPSAVGVPFELSVTYMAPKP